jgi:hypothetical protein
MFPAPPIPASHESQPSRFVGLRARPLGKALFGAAALAAVALVASEIVDIVGYEPLTFSYVARAGDAEMDQQLLIGNDGPQPVAPTLTFAALNSDGDRLAGVTVTTLFGSDHGGLVVVPGGAIDVLVFGGQGADQVADVKVTVDEAPAVDFPQVSTYVDVTPFDGKGLSTTRNSRFASVQLTNTNTSAVTVRLVYVVWSDPDPGQTQQAERVTPVGDLIEVPGNGSVMVPITGQAHAANETAFAEHRSASIKAYFSAPRSGE